jgi:hypothetical protein
MTASIQGRSGVDKTFRRSPSASAFAPLPCARAYMILRHSFAVDTLAKHTRKPPGTLDIADLDACRYSVGKLPRGASGTSCSCRSNSLSPGVAAEVLGGAWSRIDGRQPPSTFAARCQFA